MAAKTGTSKDYKDNYALGYTPRWTVGVWVGNFDASAMQKVSGITGAGPILHDVALAVFAKYPAMSFSLPGGVVRMVVCSESGLLAGPSCTHTHEEVFDVTNQPERCSGQHQPVQSQVEIISPKTADKFMVDPAAPRASQQVKLEADCPQPVCHWKVDNQALPQTTCRTWWPLVKGKHAVSVTCGGQTDKITFEVLP